MLCAGSLSSKLERRMQHALPYLAKAIAGAPSCTHCWMRCIQCSLKIGTGWQSFTPKQSFRCVCTMSDRHSGMFHSVSGSSRRSSVAVKPSTDAVWHAHYAGTIANRQNPELHDVACEALCCDMEGLQEALLQHLHVRMSRPPLHRRRSQS